MRRRPPPATDPRLSFDEALLGGLILGLAATIVAWFLTHHHQHRPTPA